MPTPESQAFLAKKPTVPPTFDGVDYEDNKALKQAQDAVIREQWVQVMMGRLVREELSKCYVREGVNHLEKCGSLRGQSKRRSRLQWRASLGFRLRSLLVPSDERVLTTHYREIPSDAQGSPGTGVLV